jgi:glycosyltransferase involved in cell wall biosynthesis
MRGRADAPDLSVVIATRDRLGLLRRAVRSAISQVDVAHEIIVVDDGSQDGTGAEMSSMADPRIRFVRLDRPVGVAGARNIGIAEARAPWLAFLDDDDLWAPSRLRAHLDIGSRTGAIMVYGARLVLDGRGNPVRAVLPERPETVTETLRWGNVIGGPSVVTARTDAVRRVGGFDPRLSALADWKLWLELLSLGTGAACTAFLVGYMEHAGNMHRRDPWGVVREFELLRADERWRLERASFLGWLASELLADGRDREAARIHLHTSGKDRSARALGRGLAALAGYARHDRDIRPLAAPAWIGAAATAADGG